MKFDKLIFLDIDGVLNAHEDLDPDVLCGRIHPEKVFTLNYVLKWSGAKVVLSSAWRYLIHRGEMNLTGLDWLLRSHGIMKDRLVGFTQPNPTDKNQRWDGTTQWHQDEDRGQLISSWINFHCDAGLKYVVLDDLDLGITAAGHPLIRTDGKVGLTWGQGKEVIEKLGAV